MSLKHYLVDMSVAMTGNRYMVHIMVGWYNG